MSDIHFDPVSGLPYLSDDGTGEPRWLGRLLPDGPMALPEFNTYHSPIPQSEWTDIDLLAAFKPPVWSQGAKGSCTGHGAGTAFTLIWCMQGEDLVRFSPCYIYGNINAGRDQGASIGDTMTALMDKGVCLEDTVPEGVIFRWQFPANADDEASRYRLVEAYRTSDPADVATAIQMGYPVCASVMVGRTFNTFDRYGVVGLDRGPGNHAICLAAMKLLPDGTWAFGGQNSWGTAWHDGGRFLITEGHMQAQSYFECVVFRAVSPGPNAPQPIAA